MKNFIFGSIFSTLVVYSLGATYLLMKRGVYNVRSSWNIFNTIY